jgi:hypothetical protein
MEMVMSERKLGKPDTRVHRAVSHTNQALFYVLAMVAVFLLNQSEINGGWSSQDNSTQIPVTLMLFLMSTYSLTLQVVLAHAWGSTGTENRSLSIIRVLKKCLLPSMVVLLTWIALTFNSNWGFEKTNALFLVAIASNFVSTSLVAISSSLLLAEARWLRLTSVLLVSQMIQALLLQLTDVDRYSVSSMFLMSITNMICLPIIVGFSTRRKVPQSTFTPKVNFLRQILTINSFSILAVIGLEGVTTTQTMLSSLDSGRFTLAAALCSTYLFTPSLSRHNLGSLQARATIRKALKWSVIVSFAVFVFTCAVISLLNKEMIFFFAGEDRWFSFLSTTGFFFLAISLVPLIVLLINDSRVPNLVSLFLLFLLVIGSSEISTFELLVIWAAMCCGSFLAVGIITYWRSTELTKPLFSGIDQRETLTGNAVSGLTVVIPAFNPGLKILGTIDSLRGACETKKIDLEIIVISDGSTDSSPGLLDALDIPSFRHILLTENKGKGHALRYGIGLSNSEFVGFVDADGDIDPSILPVLLRALIDSSADIAFASKTHTASTVNATTSRKLISKCYRVVLKTLFKLEISDTQTGAKVFIGDVAYEVCQVLREDGFSFDLEFFVAAKCFGHVRLVEVPVHINRTGSSTVNISGILKTAFEILRIFKRARLTLEYETEKSSAQ